MSPRNRRKYVSVWIDSKGRERHVERTEITVLVAKQSRWGSYLTTENVPIWEGDEWDVGRAYAHHRAVEAWLSADDADDRAEAERTIAQLGKYEFKGAQFENVVLATNLDDIWQWARNRDGEDKPFYETDSVRT